MLTPTALFCNQGLQRQILQRLCSTKGANDSFPPPRAQTTKVKTAKFYSYRQGLQRLFSPPRVQKTKIKQLCSTTRFHRQRAHRTARAKTALFYSYCQGLQPPNDEGTNGSLLTAEDSNGSLPLLNISNGNDFNGSLLQLVSRPQLQQLSSTARELKQQVDHTAGAQPARAPTALFCSYHTQRLFSPVLTASHHYYRKHNHPLSLSPHLTALGKAVSVSSRGTTARAATTALWMSGFWRASPVRSNDISPASS